MREKATRAQSIISPGARALYNADSALPRILQPELLDELPATDPSAIRSRRDLRRINWWMGNAGKAARALQTGVGSRAVQKLVEIGAGDGTFFLQVARLLGPGWKGSQVLLLDQQSLVSPETHDSLERLGWHVESLQSDVFEALHALPGRDVMLANLFLHHFSDSRLKEMFHVMSRRASLFVAVEPRRSIQALLFSRLLWLIGCNHVTRHDAIVSVQAGFRKKELSSRWPKESGWSVRESRSGQFSHLFVAQKCTD